MVLCPCTMFMYVSCWRTFARAKGMFQKDDFCITSTIEKLQTYKKGMHVELLLRQLGASQKYPPGQAVSLE